MGKLEMLKRLGKAAAKVAGVASADDRVKRLEAEKELAEMRGLLAKQALEELVSEVEGVLSIAPENAHLRDAVDEAREVLAVLTGAD